MPDRGTELAAHRQHRVVLVEDDTVNAAKSFGSPIVDDVLQQRPAKAVTLQVGANDERIFAHRAIRVAGEPTDTSKRSRLLVECDKGHVAVVVELRQPRQHLVRKTLAGRQEPQPDVIRR
jgi:hypothetical protein